MVPTGIDFVLGAQESALSLYYLIRIDFEVQ